MFFPKKKVNIHIFFYDMTLIWDYESQGQGKKYLTSRIVKNYN